MMFLRGGGISQKIYIADIDKSAIERGARDYGFTPVEISEEGPLPFDDKYFDIVYCSSVIEHVTVPKQATLSIKSGREFKRLAYHHQKMFANEIRREAKVFLCRHKIAGFCLNRTPGCHLWGGFPGEFRWP